MTPTAIVIPAGTGFAIVAISAGEGRIIATAGEHDNAVRIAELLDRFGLVDVPIPLEGL